MLFRSNIGVKVVSMTDSVELTKYGMSIDQVATKTVFTTGTLGMAATDVFTEEGDIQINGEMIHVAKGATLEDVYAEIRDCCESMNIAVTPVNALGNETELANAIRILDFPRQLPHLYREAE